MFHALLISSTTLVYSSEASVCISPGGRVMILAGVSVKTWEAVNTKTN